MNSNKFVIMALIGAVAAQDDTTWEYDGGVGTDYSQHGADWDLDYPGCGDSNQSPINLITVDRTAAEFEYVVYDIEEDGFEKLYENQVNTEVTWNGHTTEVAVDTEVNGLSGFQSALGNTIFGADTAWEAIQFHFSAGSEHTINGVRHDLEMQSIHTPGTGIENEFLAAAVGVLFSVDDWTIELTEAEEIIIDTFFQSLQWDYVDADGTAPSPTVDLVSYGNLMELLDFNNRWAYSGSITTPPCSTNVYWNVLSNVYPIKQEHLDLYHTQLAKATTASGVALDEEGNWREVQDIDEQNVIYISDDGKISQKITNLFKGASTYLSVGAAITAVVAATI